MYGSLDSPLPTHWQGELAIRKAWHPIADLFAWVRQKAKTVRDYSWHNGQGALLPGSKACCCVFRNLFGRHLTCTRWVRAKWACPAHKCIDACSMPNKMYFASLIKSGMPCTCTLRLSCCRQVFSESTILKMNTSCKRSREHMRTCHNVSDK